MINTPNTIYQNEVEKARNDMKQSLLNLEKMEKEMCKEEYNEMMKQNWIMIWQEMKCQGLT